MRDLFEEPGNQAQEGTGRRRSAWPQSPVQLVLNKNNSM